MKMKKHMSGPKAAYHFLRMLFAMIFLPTIAWSQLSVAIQPAKIVGRKIIVPISFTNNLGATIQSARASMFLQDGDGQVMSQSTKWVIGGTGQKTGLAPGTAGTYNFVFSLRPDESTNVQTMLLFGRVLTVSGQLMNVNNDVHIEPSKPSSGALYQRR